MKLQEALEMIFPVGNEMFRYRWLENESTKNNRWKFNEKNILVNNKGEPVTMNLAQINAEDWEIVEKKKEFLLEISKDNQVTRKTITERKPIQCILCDRDICKYELDLSSCGAISFREGNICDSCCKEIVKKWVDEQ